MKRAYWQTAIIGCGIIVVALLAARWESTRSNNRSASESHETPEPHNPPTDTPASIAAPSVPDWHFESLDDLPAQLADETRRPEALRRLGAVPYQRIDNLFQLARHATDARVREDLLARAYALQQQLASNPPPVSISVNNASLVELADALNKEMSAHIMVLDFSPAPQTFTLEVTGKPFWEVLGSAAAQHPLSFDPVFGRMQMALHEDPSAIWSRAIDGPFSVLMNVRDNQIVNPRATPPASMPKLQWIYRYIVGVDPRLWVLDSSLKLTLGPDDAGNVLLPPVDANTLKSAHDMYPLSPYGDATFTPPEHPGKVLAKVRLEGTIRIVTSEYEGVINSDQPPEQSVTLGDTTITAQFHASAGTPRHYSLALSAENPNIPSPFVSYVLDDGTERSLSSSNTGRGSSGSSPAAFNGGVPYPAPPQPFELRFRVPRTIEKRHVSFEVNNVPLPALPQ